MPGVAAESYLRERVLPTQELFQKKMVVYAIRKKRSRIWLINFLEYFTKNY